MLSTLRNCHDGWIDLQSVIDAEVLIGILQRRTQETSAYLLRTHNFLTILPLWICDSFYHAWDAWLHLCYVFKQYFLFIWAIVRLLNFITLAGHVKLVACRLVSKLLERLDFVHSLWAYESTCIRHVHFIPVAFHFRGHLFPLHRLLYRVFEHKLVCFCFVQVLVSDKNWFSSAFWHEILLCLQVIIDISSHWFTHATLTFLIGSRVTSL